MTEHELYMQKALVLAKEAAAVGEIPVGAVVVRDGRIIAAARNEKESTHDATAHAERMLASRASAAFSREMLWESTLYTTCEPCPMCTGAIYWANIGKIVFGITETKLLELTGSDDKNPTFNMGADKVVAAGQKDIRIEGPFPEIEEEIEEAHRGFWNP